MVRRMKRELPPRWDGTPRFPESVIVEPLEVDYTGRRAARPPRAAPSTPSCAPKARATTRERYATEFVLKLLKKRLVLLAAGLRRTLEKHRESLRKARRARLPRSRQHPGLLRRQVEGIDDEERRRRGTGGRQRLRPSNRPRRCSVRLRRRKSACSTSLRHVGRTAAGRAGLQGAGAHRLAAGRRSSRAGSGPTSASSSSPSTAPRRSGCTDLLARRGARRHGAACRSCTAAWQADERERVKAAFQADPADLAGAHPARDRRGLRGHRPAEPLLAARSLRDSVEPEPDGAAQRPHRPPRPESAPRSTSITSSARAIARTRAGAVERDRRAISKAISSS